MAISIAEAADITGPTQASGFRLGYRPELDGLRGISILLVLVHHFYHPVLPGGFLGVDIFFVLSGFLITSLLLQEWNSKGSINLRTFYIRRGLRLMPALLGLVLALGVFAAIFLSHDSALLTYQGIWLTLSYVSNWLYALHYVSPNNPLGITWSLAIEEQFYLLWPVILRFVLRSGISRRGLLYALALCVAFVVVYRILLLNQGASIARLYYASDSRADALLIGCIIALLVAENWFSKNRKFEFSMKLLAAVAFVFLAFMALGTTFYDVILYQAVFFTIIPLSAGVILVVLITWPLKTVVSALRFPPLVWIGQVSYGLYLWHWPVRWFIYGEQSLPTSTVQLLAAVFLSLALTTLSYYLIEKPFLRLKKRFA